MDDFRKLRNTRKPMHARRVHSLSLAVNEFVTEREWFVVHFKVRGSHGENSAWNERINSDG